MWDLVLYLGITLVGYVAGDIAKRKNMTLNWSRKVQTFAISALVFTMGVRIGSNDEVVGKLDSIGVYAAVFTDDRSEERRVGKECRSRWSPYH